MRLMYFGHVGKNMRGKKVELYFSVAMNIAVSGTV